MLTKQKGDIALANAIAYFVKNEYEVCLPIGDKREYDLIVEKNTVMSRVQVKYAGWYPAKNRHYVALRVMGGNQSYHTAKRYQPDSFDLLFVYTANGVSYVFPWQGDLITKAVLSIEAPKYAAYRIMQG